MNCKKCGTINTHDAIYCKKCGSELNKEVYCEKCNKKMEEDELYCTQCGHKKVLKAGPSMKDNEKKIIIAISVFIVLLALFFTIIENT